MTPEEERLYNAIENVVNRMYKNKGAEALMADIRRRFPSPVCLIESNAYALSLSGLSRINGFYFTMIPALARRSQREAFGPKPKLNRLSVMSRYLKTLFTGIRVECYYAVLLSATGIAIRTVLIGKGTENATLFDLRQTLSLAVQYSARAVVLCHNHPGGTLQPSREDINCTLQAMNAMAALQVPLLDHIIIAHNRAVSIRASGIIPTKLWAVQDPKNRLLRDWIDVDPMLEDLN